MYGPITKLSELDPTLPDGTVEPVSNLDDAVRQTRAFLATFLGVAHDDEGKIKPGAVPEGGVASGSIRGSSLSGDQREILQGSVRSQDIAPGAILTQHYGAASIPGSALSASMLLPIHFSQRVVSGNHIGLATILGENIKSDEIALSHMKANSVGTSQLINGNVVGAKIAANTISPDKLSSSANNTLLLGNGTTFLEYPVDPAGVVALSVVNGKIKFTSSGGGSGAGELTYALAIERQNKGVGGGASNATTWNQRNASGSWTIFKDVSGYFELDGAWLRIKVAGDYLVRAWATTYAVGANKLGLFKKRSSAPHQLLLLGTNAYAPAGATSISTLEGFITAAAEESFTLFHYTAGADADGLGKAVNINDPGGAGTTEFYAGITIIKV